MIQYPWGDIMADMIMPKSRNMLRGYSQKLEKRPNRGTFSVKRGSAGDEKE